MTDLSKYKKQAKKIGNIGLAGAGKAGAYKPYFKNMNTGLNGLGSVNSDVLELVENNKGGLNDLLNKLEREFSASSNIFTFDDNDLLYNKGITTNQKKAWVYYKRSVLNIPMQGGWKKYYLKGSTEQPFGTSTELTELVKDRAIFYSNGQFLPLAVYSWGNIYERIDQLELDKDYIIANYGEAVYLDHKNVLNAARPAQIKFNDPDVSKRAVITCTSTIAKTFTVKELKPEYMSEVAEAQQFNNKGRNVDKKKRIDINFNGETSFALREVFVKWLYTLDIRRNFTNTSPYEISNFYVYGFPISDVYKEDSGKSAPEIKQAAREEGEVLFSKFLNEVLTEQDSDNLNNAFNAKYNSWADLNYAAIPIGLETASTVLGQPFAIRPEKREAIAYMEAVGSGILAYDVGVGKTFSALLELANALHQGKCKRPLVVVPNPTYNNWLKEAFGGIDKETGKRFDGILSNLGYKYNDWYNLNTQLVKKLDKTNDLTELIPEGTVTFMSYEGLRQLGFSSNIDRQFIDEFKNILGQTINDPTLSSTKENVLNGLSKKEIAQAAESFGKVNADGTKEKTARDEAKDEKNIEEILGLGNKNAVADMDVLGFDYIVIDEAHRCKNVFSGVKADEEGKKNYLLTGVSSTTGIKAFFLCNYIQRVFGRNVMLLTATPFTNSPLEVYSMLSLVGYELLVESGYYNINDFFNQFAKIDVEYTVGIGGEVKVKDVIKGFNNRRILQKLIFTKVNYKTGEDVGVKRPCKINLPMLSVRRIAENNSVLSGLGNIAKPAQKVNSSDQILTYLEMTDQQAANQDEIYDRINEALSPKGGKIDKKNLFRYMSASLDNAFSPFMYKMAELTPTSPADFVENSPKIKYACDCILSVKKYHEDKGEPVSGQVIYSNRGVAYFHLIKKYLHSKGFKTGVMYEGTKVDEVMIIAGGGKDEFGNPVEVEKVDKEIIKEAFLAGVVKVIIGSATIREGINLQKNGTCLYNLYPEWTPTNIRQLEGRIWRQGNKFGYVRIVMPLVENSMDVFVFQKLEEKTARINDLFYREGLSNVLDLDDIDPEQIKYALIKDIGKLAIIDFNIEKAKAKQALQNLADDFEAIKKIAGLIDDVDSSRKGSLNQLRENAVQKVQSFIDSYKNDEGYKDKVKYAMGVLDNLNQVINNPVDDDLIKLLNKLQNYNNKTSWSFQAYIYQLDDFVKNIRELRKKERSVLKPKGFSLDSNFTEVSEFITKEFNEKKEIFIQQFGKEDKNYSEAPRFKEIYDEIIAKKEKLNINGQTVSERVKEFEKLNYLLNYKAADVQSNVCVLPDPNQKIVIAQSCPPMDNEGKRRIDAEGLALLTKCIENEPNTKEQNTDKKGNYTDTRKLLHDKIIADFTANKPCEVKPQPIAILTGGAPGAGKSTFINKFAAWINDESKIVKIDADEIRAKLPEYKGWNAFNTHAETKDIVNQLLDKVGKPCESDLVYDGTMNKAENYKPLIAKLKSLGYKIFVIYIQVPKEVSMQRVMSRYQSKGRYVPFEVIDEVFSKGLTAYEEIIKSADGFVRVDGIKQEIIEQGGMQLPKERNYQFKQELSEIEVTPEGKTKPKNKLLLYKYKAKAIAIKLKLLK